MTDKVQKIKDWISKTQDGLMDANGNFEYSSDEGAFNVLSNLDYYIDSLQEETISDTQSPVIFYGLTGSVGSPKEEPVSEDLEEAASNYAEEHRIALMDYETGEIEMNKSLDVVNAFKAGAKWQFNQLEKNRLKHCNSITNEQAELEQGFIDQHLDKHQRMPTFLDAIEYGMRLQKEQDIKHGYVTFLQGEKHFANYILEMINSGWHIVAIKTACNDKIKED